MSDLWYPRKEAPLLGLTGMGGGVASLMWAGAGSVGPFELWCCGENEYGALGQNQSESVVGRRSSPVQIPGNWIGLSNPGYSSFFGIKGDKVGEGGTLWSWGQNNFGNLGQNEGGNPGIWRSSPTQVGSYDDWVFVSSTTYDTCAIRSPGALYSWGRQGPGYSLGLSSPDNTHKSSPTQIPGTWKADAYSMRNTGGGGMALRASDNALFTWGNNQQGQLMQNTSGLYSPSTPDGNSSPQLIPGNWKAVQGGNGVNWVLDTSDQLWACGTGGKGVSPNSRVSSPVQVPGTWGSNADKSGEIRHLFYAGNDSAIGQKNGYTQMWGYNGQGQLGTRNTTDYYTSVAYVYGNFAADSVSQNGTSSAVVKTDGTLWGWGSDYGRFAQPGPYSSPTSINNRSAPIQITSDTDWYAVHMAKGGWFGLKHQS